MSDLVERLRTYPCWSDLARLHDEAADEIERLRAELAERARDEVALIEQAARLTAELAEARELLREARPYVVSDHVWHYEKGGWLDDCIDAALAKEKKE